MSDARTSRPQGRQKDRLGRHGEDLAVQHLVHEGVLLIARNWRCPEGELDIIGAEGDALVICEVKTRTSTRFGTPLEAVTEAKVQRMQRLAHIWCREHRVHPPRIRYDVVEVLAPGDAEPVITYHRGVI
jgi:putative endonuclease